MRINIDKNQIPKERFRWKMKISFFFHWICARCHRSRWRNDEFRWTSLIFFHRFWWWSKLVFFCFVVTVISIKKTFLARFFRLIQVISLSNLMMMRWTRSMVVMFVWWNSWPFSWSMTIMMMVNECLNKPRNIKVQEKRKFSFVLPMIGWLKTEFRIDFD